MRRGQAAVAGGFALAAVAIGIIARSAAAGLTAGGLFAMGFSGSIFLLEASDLVPSGSLTSGVRRAVGVSLVVAGILAITSLGLLSAHITAKIPLLAALVVALVGACISLRALLR